ncbi:TorD/DmsD family molecular chaperone [Variovorax saccharolyticus]|uniref:TorD/DmsD family molecular chaperone n=1 Tax=Variovorax saccharolyticus TaxID=3053516 RepID=UPI00257585FC|nr:MULTISPECIES: molecular chaperone TorD family protein [unclassified Variovorax]MDM0016013.1 molecular chaperone TorD family protein [Variovorax sp. J22R187]MDM0025053.1 molecular chaperone TorD family protein [Variovorax sp. J31P216]
MNTRIPVTSALDEEVARAELYGLLARLWYAAPDAELLEAFQVAPTEAPAAGAFLEEPWRQLVGAARSTALAELRTEYDALFGGIGKPEVYLFGSHYLSGFLNDKPLAQLRNDLDRLGLARDASVSESEDHVACLFEVMRYLIAGDDVEVANLTQQKAFFATHLQPWLPAMCDAVAAHPRAGFYAALAGLTLAFSEVETQGFDMSH